MVIFPSKIPNIQQFLLLKKGFVFLLILYFILAVFVEKQMNVKSSISQSKEAEISVEVVNHCCVLPNYHIKSLKLAKKNY